MPHVVALDAVTGAKKWEYAHPLTKTVFCCGPNNRGLAYYGGRVYMGTLHARLVALDTADGHVAWSLQVADNTSDTASRTRRSRSMDGSSSAWPAPSTAFAARSRRMTARGDDL